MSDSSIRRTVIGIIGCGNVFDKYAKGLTRFDHLPVRWCADIDRARAEQAAKRWSIPAFGSVEELLADPTVEIVVNLTPPTAHATTTLTALRSDKHVFVEKPLAVTPADAAEVLACAEAAGRLLGAAPETFLGSAAQTGRAVVDDGRIGDLVGAAAFHTHNRLEAWHPDPTLFFKPGGGPVLDLGGYYITSLVNCLGPVADVAGMTWIGMAQRTVTSPDRLVDVIDVDVPTHASAVLRFASGVPATVLMSFDVWDARLPFIEIYGTRGTVSLPDPTRHDGDVLVKLRDDDTWQVVPPVTPLQKMSDSHPENVRGLGVADLAAALRGGTHRASGALAYHVLEVLDAIEVSSQSHSVVRLTGTCDRPAPVAWTRLEA